MKWAFLLNIMFVTSVLSLSLGPFQLQNAPAALTNLATSASASASRPAEPPSHIADLRRKQEKVEQLQSEKLLAEEDDADGDLSVEGAGESDNEAAPTLLQKKIGKILKKLRFISSLTRKSSGAGGGGEANANGTDGGSGNTTPTTTTEKAITLNDTLEKIPDHSENDITTSLEVTTQRIQTFQKVIYPHSRYDRPFKVSFDVNEKIVNQHDTEDVDEASQNIEKVGETGRLGQIGVFFAEILGSIVGLLYGAAAHLTSGGGGGRDLE